MSLLFLSLFMCLSLIILWYSMNETKKMEEKNAEKEHLEEDKVETVLNNER